MYTNQQLLLVDQTQFKLEDTFLLLDALEADAEELKAMNAAIFLEIGSGSGCVSAFAGKILDASTLYLTTDINYRACNCTRRTGSQNNVTLDAIQTSFTQAPHSRLKNSVDIICFNPPYVPTVSTEVSEAQDLRGIEGSWAGGSDGMQDDEYLSERRTYSISNAKAKIVLDLDGGNSANRTKIQAFQKFGFNELYTLNQLWLVQKIEGATNVYSLRNLRSGTYMDMSLDSGSESANGNLVYGYEAGGTQGATPTKINNGRRLRMEFFTNSSLKNGTPAHNGTFINGDLLFSLHSRSRQMRAIIGTSKSPYFFGRYFVLTLSYISGASGVYSISNAKAKIVLDLDGGNSANRTKIQAFQKFGFNELYTLNQLWLVQKIEGATNVYSLRNLRSGTYMDMSLDSGSESANGNLVYGYEAGGTQGATPHENQQWEAIKDGVFYKLRNVSGGTFLELPNGNDQNGTRIHTWGAASYGNRANQLWGFERRSRSAEEIRTALDNTRHKSTDFKSYPVDEIYFVLDKAFHTQIRDANLKSFVLRSQIFDCDDFAWVHKAGVAKWGYENIKADGLSILCGFIVGSTTDEGHANNWTLSDDLSSILFFEPQNGEFLLDNYAAAWGIF
ncbi:hypothetical protein BT96DRAFT_993465 [Gymnopus androsaceus JB14]|uniref:Uncharacterized protein n=1 Tax=Gymnopus androsaceus JB14 TaxID=1447944 RepID=A0A6A4HNG2_9AGAR|nr:hypothetical protein BT96DRAFT_993465 [Gymnopus androsaceus JB14]